MISPNSFDLFVRGRLDRLDEMLEDITTLELPVQTEHKADIFYALLVLVWFNEGVAQCPQLLGWVEVQTRTSFCTNIWCSSSPGADPGPSLFYSSILKRCMKVSDVILKVHPQQPSADHRTSPPSCGCNGSSCPEQGPVQVQPAETC